MSKQNRLKGKSTKTDSILKGKSDLSNETSKQLLLFSFKDICRDQGQWFSDWAIENLLEGFLDKLHEYCKFTVTEAQAANLTIYGDFPPTSAFKHPKHITPDANWAAIRLGGKERVAGHLVRNIFYIVFLDKEHDFYPSQKKHT